MNPFDLIPGFSWVRLAIAAALVAAVVGAFAMFVKHERDIGRAEVRAEWAADKEVWRAALAKQKGEAATLLAAETARANAAQNRMNEFLRSQEKTDATHQTVVADLGRKLAAATGLRDPYASGRGGSGGGTKGQAVAAAGDRPGDPAEASGVLSERFAGMLRGLFAEADDINIAYASCRADSVNIRAAAELEQH